MDWAAKQNDSRDVRLDDLTTQIVDRVKRLARFAAEHGHEWAEEDQRVSAMLSPEHRESFDKLRLENGIDENWNGGDGDVLRMMIASIVVDVHHLRDAAGRDPD